MIQYFWTIKEQYSGTGRLVKTHTSFLETASSPTRAKQKVEEGLPYPYDEFIFPTPNRWIALGSTDEPNTSIMMLTENVWNKIFYRLSIYIMFEKELDIED